MKKIAVTLFIGISLFTVQNFSATNSRAQKGLIATQPSDGWKKQKTVVTPAARIIPGMAFDERRNVVVMFGGDRLRQTPTSDTWEYDGKDWKQIKTTNSPAARYGHQMIFNKNSGKVLLFGGYDKKENLFNDTWEFDGRNWVKLKTNAPPIRRSPAIAYDEARGKIVLFGGLGSTGGVPRENELFLQDTWEFDGKKWEQVSKTGPKPRYGPHMVYVPASKKIILFGGNDHSGNIYSDVWEWNGQEWKILSDTGINPRATFKLIYSKKRNSILLFGGFDKGNIYGDVWEWANSRWQKLDVPEMPKLFFPGVTFDANRNKLIMFGQSSAQGAGETWELDLSTIDRAEAVSSQSFDFTIDGTLFEDEWKAAHELELTSGGKAFYRFTGDELLLGIRGVGEGWITVYATVGKDIYALHASAALGTAVYKNKNGVWKNTQKFEYEVRDNSMSAEAVRMREEFYKANGWVANVSAMGKLNEREFKISNKFFDGKAMKIAIVYAAETKPISLQSFPKNLSDDTLNMELIIGNTPPELKFQPEKWALIKREKAENSQSFSSQNKQTEESIDRLNDIAFYTDYVWSEKNAKNSDGSVYRARLKKEKELSGIVSVNRSFDSAEEAGAGELKPFLTGVSGWDPVEKKIRFLDFSRDGMMIEGTVDLIDADTIQYDFKFAFPGNKRKLIGRDILKFNKTKTEFVWSSFVKNKDNQYRKINETVMIRNNKIISE